MAEYSNILLQTVGVDDNIIFANRVKNGYAITGSLPYGYKIVDHRVVPDEEKKVIVQDIYNQMELLNSTRKVMKYINGKYGTAFLYGRMLRMLTNALYIGTFHNVENYCEPIITKEQFNKVQRLLKMNVRERKNKVLYIFSGLVVCDHCKTKMSGKYSSYGEKYYYYYKCNKDSFDGICDNKLSMNTSIIEDYLIKNVRPMLVQHLLATEQANEEKPIQRDNRKEIEKKLQRLNDLYVNGFIDMEKYKADYDDLQSQIIDIVPREQKKDLTVFKEFLKSNFEETYYDLTDLEKQALWRTIIKEIRVSGKDVLDIKFL